MYPIYFLPDHKLVESLTELSLSLARLCHLLVLLNIDLEFENCLSSLTYYVFIHHVYSQYLTHAHKRNKYITIQQQNNTTYS